MYFNAEVSQGDDDAFYIQHEYTRSGYVSFQIGVDRQLSGVFELQWFMISAAPSFERMIH